MREQDRQELADLMRQEHRSKGARPSYNDLARAVLACGLVVPAGDVLNLAQQWEDDEEDHGRHSRYRDGNDCAAELRALTQQEPQ